MSGDGVPSGSGRSCPYLDEGQFCGRVVDAYNRGTADRGLPADADVGRSLIPAGTASWRDFTSLAPELPELIPDKCIGCMECVTECPDTAILAKIVAPDRLENELSAESPAEANALRGSFTRTAKYYDGRERQKKAPGMFGLFIDPTKCKGCAECVAVCGARGALKMVRKDPEVLTRARSCFRFYKDLGPTPKEFIDEKLLLDMMLLDGDSLLYVGGAGSCMGCGEATALRMLLAATAFVHGPQGMGMVAATGCNTVYTSTYPYNPYRIPWTNSLFENAPAVAMGVRMTWDRRGWKEKRLWVVGGDGAMYDIGFQSLSRLMQSGMDIKVIVLDTQVYSNTGGQASGASFLAQEAKYAQVGKSQSGRVEARKELAQICMMHPATFVAQVTPAHANHFYRAVLAANEYPGPAVIIAYATCQPEHGVGDDRAYHQAKLAVDSRAFPLMIYDPRKGETVKERLDLRANPAPLQDWYTDPRTGQVVDFTAFAKTEGRFTKHFDRDGKPDEAIQRARDERLANWRRLQDLAGMRPSAPAPR